MKSPRVVVVGAGLMGRWHVDAVRHAGGTLTGVVDLDESKARALAGHGAAPYATLEAALATRPDLIHICTPLASHATLAGASLEAGCHVILEKPATQTSVEAAALTARATAAGKLLVPVHQFVHQRGVQRIMEDRERLGMLREIEFSTASAGADRRPEARDLTAAEIVPHAFSLARAIGGLAVGELPWRLDCPSDGEWRFEAVTPEGCRLAGVISMRARPTFAQCRVAGEGGSATADLFQGFATFEPGTSSTAYKIMRPFAVGMGLVGAAATQLASRALRGERAYPGLRALCATTYRAITVGGSPPFRTDELVDVARARDQLISQLSAR